METAVPVQVLQKALNKILAAVDYSANRNNLFIVAVSIGVGMIPLVAPTFFAQMPKVLSPILYSGILLAAFAAVLINAFFNGAGGVATGDETVAAAKSAGIGH